MQYNRDDNMNKNQTKDKIWVHGFLGFLGFLGFQAFTLHNPWRLFFFSYFRYLRE